jgi:hypothetical protein
MRTYVMWPVLVVTFAGCSRITEDGGAIPSGVVFGQVTLADGTPAVGVSVAANVHDSSADCGEARNGLSGGAPAHADGRGFYRKVVTAPLVPVPLCASARVVQAVGTPINGPVGVAARAITLSTDLLQDSVRIDLRMP